MATAERRFTCSANKAIPLLLHGRERGKIVPPGQRRMRGKGQGSILGVGSEAL